MYMYMYFNICAYLVYTSSPSPQKPLYFISLLPWSVLTPLEIFTTERVSFEILDTITHHGQVSIPICPSTCLC
jgi:hypothetical protein